jgi:hypothetical protein
MYCLCVNVYCTTATIATVIPIAVKYIIAYHKYIHTHTHTHTYEYVEAHIGFAAKLRGNKPELRLDDYIKGDVTETERESENWIKLAHG